MNNILIAALIAVGVTISVIIIVVYIFLLKERKKYIGMKKQKAFDDGFSDTLADGDKDISEMAVTNNNNTEQRYYDRVYKSTAHYVIILLIVVAFIFLLVSNIIEFANTVKSLQALNLDISASVFRFISTLLSEIAFCAFAIFVICKVKDIRARKDNS